ncbi:YoaK family protein [Anaerorhabdus sp.]|uniref:YoaK family protein n=1 Tax=Anaerorhabdus sp. TaxID=1872524 RepID=UPI002FC5C5D0
MKQTRQISDSVRLGLLLAISGGFMDAYSYLFRGKVFANAQTGNLLLLGLNIFEGHWDACIKYLVPIVCFMIGVFLATCIRRSFQSYKKFHWRQFTILIEAIVLFSVAFLPQSMNLLVNSLISLSCGIQIESFKKIHGLGASTTMCVGNLRSATSLLSDYIYTKDKEDLKKGLLYLLIIFFFVMGAVLGNVFIQSMGQYSILICSLLLLVAFLSMFYHPESY